VIKRAQVNISEMYEEAKLLTKISKFITKSDREPVKAGNPTVI